MTRFRSRSQIVAEAGFWSLAGLGALTLALVITAGAKGAAALREVRAGQSVMADCGCSTVVAAESGIAWTAGVLLFLAMAVLASVVVYALIVLRRTRRAVPERVERSARIREIAAGLGLGNSVVPVDHPAMPIFCAGLFRPRLYLDRRAAGQLSDDELRAVLEHERYHLRHRDSLRRWIVEAMTLPLRVVPGFGSVVRDYRSWVELAADESAVAARGNADGLGQALLKFVEPMSSIEPSFAGATDRRIDQLLGRWSWRNTVRFLGMVIGFGAAVSVAVRSADAGVARLTDNLRTTAVGQCQQMHMPTCIVPPLRSTIGPNQPKQMSTP